MKQKNKNNFKRYVNRMFTNKNPMWKGDRVGYPGVHEWARNNIPKPKICTCGNIVNVDASNISGKYLRKLSDWKWQCRKCHMENDGRSDQLRKSGKSRIVKNKKCIHCKREYHPKRKEQKYCSHKCFYRSRRK